MPDGNIGGATIMKYRICDKAGARRRLRRSAVIMALARRAASPNRRRLLIEIPNKQSLWCRRFRLAWHDVNPHISKRYFT